MRNFVQSGRRSKEAHAKRQECELVALSPAERLCHVAPAHGHGKAEFAALPSAAVDPVLVHVGTLAGPFSGERKLMVCLASQTPRKWLAPPPIAMPSTTSSAASLGLSPHRSRVASMTARLASGCRLPWSPPMATV